MKFQKFFNALVTIASLFWVATPAHSAETAATPHFTVTWLGGATMLITFGDLTILTDPVLGADGFRMGDPNVQDLDAIKLHRRLSPFPGVSLGKVDLVLLSHAHEDHFDQEAQSRIDRAMPFILPPADVESVEAKGFRNLGALDWGKTRRLDAGTGQVEITATAARHSRNPQTAQKLGVGNGYWIAFSSGDWKRTLYWTGDTMPTPEVIAAVQALGRPDVMVPNVGGVGTTGPLGRISMGAADVVALAAEIRPKTVLPIHHSTFAMYREPISELVARSEGKPYRLVIAEGTTVLFE